MSLWPIAIMQCRGCDAWKSVYDYSLDTDDEQQEFFDALLRDGWDVRSRPKDIEADDDGIVSGYCPKCKKDEQMDRYTAVLAMILLAGLPVLARLWVLVRRADEKLFE